MTDDDVDAQDQSQDQDVDRDSQGPPDACPFCGGDVVDGPMGPVCDACERRILAIDTRGYAGEESVNLGQFDADVDPADDARDPSGGSESPDSGGEDDG